MKFITKIFNMYLWYLVLFSLSIFLIGLNETVRNEAFNIVEDSDLYTEIQNQSVINTDYLEFKNTYIFSNSPFIDFMNFLGYALLFYLFMRCWIIGREIPVLTLSQIFTWYLMGLILLVYIIIYIFNYLIDIFVNQLIVILFNDIYTNIYMYSIFVENYIILLMIGYVIAWLSNQVKQFGL